MEKDIPFTGLTAVPSDYECSDGELTQAYNLLNENGMHTPLLSPKNIYNLGEERNIVFIHTTRLMKNFIVMAKDSDNCCTFLGYIQKEDSTAQTNSIDSLPTDEPITDINAVGNILLISTAKDIHYFFWKTDKYIYLGTSIPDVDIRFALQGELTYKLYENNLITVEKGNSTSISGDYTAIAQMQMATYNHRIELITKNTYYNYFDSSVKIEKGKQYKIIFTGEKNSGLKNIQEVQFWGTKSGDTTTSLIYTADTRKNRGVYYFTVEDDYSNIYVWGKTYDPVRIATLTLYVAEEILSDKYVISYNEDGYNSVMAAMDQFVNKEAVEKEKFIYPFFVRYGLNLYDGTVVNISEPILLIPNSGYVPVVNYTTYDKHLRMYAVIATLQYSIKNNIAEEWRDLITGISIYASQPIYPYSQGENYDSYINKFKFKFYNKNEGSTLHGLSSTYSNVHLNGNSLNGYYTGFDLMDMIVGKFDFGNASLAEEWGICQIAPREQDDINKDVTSTMAFYKIKDFVFNDIKRTVYVETADDGTETEVEYFADLDLDNDALKNLTTRTQLDNSVIPYTNFAHARLHSYNNRSHLYDAAVALPEPANFYALNSYTDAWAEDLQIEEPSRYDIYVYLHSEDGEKVLHKQFKGNLSTWRNLRWFFYPDRNAYKVVIYRYNEERNFWYDTVTYDLTAHDYLAGAYWFTGSFDTQPTTGRTNVAAIDLDLDAIPTDNWLQKPSVIYVSLPNNPFAYRTVDTVSIGAQKVLGLASAARALSEGQFGQFPLYAFANNGVWAMELSTEGSYSARQPITRDVCSDSNSITQIDGAVLFATDRGIMEISGSQTQCLTDIINAPDVFSLDRLPGLSRLYPEGIPQIECTFAEFRKDARIAYDYINQRIVLFNPQKPYAYVFSMKSKLWGIIASSLTLPLNSYPEAYAMARISGNNCLVDISRSDETSSTGLLVTRPIKLDAGSMLKTFDAVFMRGLFGKGKVQVVLYGSRDNINWHLVHSAKQHYLRGFRGTPYKFFRIVAITNLAIGETLLGASVSYMPRLTNQMR